MKRDKAFYKRLGIGIILFGIILALIWPVYSYTSEKYVDCPQISVDDGWDIACHGKTWADVVLSKTDLGLCNTGDKITLVRTLPKEPVIETPVLQIYTIHSIIDVYLDDELIYSYGRDLHDQGYMIGYGRNRVALPKDYAGKTVRVELEVTENNAFQSISEMRIFTGNTMNQYQISEARISVAISLFLILFGIFAVVVSIIVYVTDGSFARLFCISLFTFYVGVWTFCNLDIVSFITPDLRTKVYFEYISFYLMILPLLGYFWEKVHQPYIPKWLKSFYYMLLGADGALVVIAFLCHFTGEARFPVFVPFNQLIMFLGMIFVVAEEAVSLIKQPREQHALVWGFGIAIVLVAVELARFNLSKYFLDASDRPYGNIVGVGAVSIVIALASDLAVKVRINLMTIARESLLKRMAYMDELTGLANRRKCEDELAEIQDAEEPYSIVSLDMNGLKYFNDTYGHDAGDKALREFAEVLGKSFPNASTVGRMGGDEFIVILPNTEKSEALELLENFLTNIDSYNDKAEGAIRLSAAYGFAFSYEARRPHDVLLLADDRMYECKKQMKKDGSTPVPMR